MISILPPGLALLLSLTFTTLARESQELCRMTAVANLPLVYLEKDCRLESGQKLAKKFGKLRDQIDSGFKDGLPPVVSVQVDGIMNAQVNVDDAHRVAKELNGN
jgi:hypothetical protein